MAKSALSRAIKGYPSACQEPIVKVNDGVIHHLRDTRAGTIYDYSWVPSNPKNGDEVELITDGKTRAQIHAERSFLNRRGFYSVGKSIYRYQPKDLTEHTDPVH